LKPRAYQVSALESIWQALKTEYSVLLESPCAAGKTIIFAKIAQRLLAENPSFRVLILTDREVLVTQSRDKLLRVAPELSLSVGVACASVSGDKRLDARVTIASRQTLIRRLGSFAPVQLVIVDECHLLATPKEGDAEPPDQFGAIISTLRKYNPRMRLLGVTATPYRLNDGYIYGTRNAPKCQPYFTEVHHRITVGELQSMGFLAPLIGKVAVPAGLETRLDNTSLVSGEYNLGTISGIMSEGQHIRSAVEAWQQHASDRKKTIAFCVTIAHAEKLAAAFNADGIRALPIHSELDTLDSYANMESLRNGEGQVFCSVAQLTTGMDVADIDCILMARPTKSAALYKQILGRGQRISPGKENCLVLDMVGNSNEFGTDLDKLKIRYRQSTAPSERNPAGIKYCPTCDIELHPAVRVCPECGYEFVFEADAPDLKDVEFGSQPPVTCDVMGIYGEPHIGKESGKTLLKVRVEIDLGTAVRTANMWMCFEGDGYSGYAVTKGKALWHQLTFGMVPYPDSTADALELIKNGAWSTPSHAVVDISGKWPDIKTLIFDVPF